MASLRLRIEGSKFRDPHGREIILRGINVAGDAKIPATPNIPSHVSDGFFDGDHVSFVGRPFSVDDAPLHLSRLRRWGYNTIRYIFTWEAIEHAGPGQYDEAWMQHTISVLRLAKEHGFFVFMDPHQDVVCTHPLRRCTPSCKIRTPANLADSGQDSAAARGLRCGRFTPAD